MKRDRHCPCHVTLETCESIKLEFGGMELIQRRDKTPSVKPIVRGKRLTQLVPGDWVEYQDQAYEVDGVEMYR